MFGHRTIILAMCLTLAGPQLFAQTRGTVHKHRVVDESPADIALRTAEAAIEKGDYDSAEKSLREVVAQDGNNYRAWFDLGFVLNAKGQRPQAIEAYKKSVALDPKVFESNLNLGLMLARDGDPEAEKYLRAATALKPTSTPPQKEVARAWMALGHVLEKTNPKGAAEAFKSASVLEPKDAAPHLAAALALERAKQYSGAESEYKRAAELDPKSSEALAGLVNIYQQTGRVADAETELRKYVRLDPQNAAAHLQLGRILASTGKNEDAIIEFRAAIALSPDNAAAVRQLSDLLLETKKYDEAAALLKPLVQNAPNDPNLHYALGRVLMRQLNYPAAQTELLSALKLKSDMGEAYTDLAIVANENKNYELALRALDARAKFLPETPASYFLRATIFDHLRATKLAIENYHLFLEASNGKYPDQEWQAKHRLIALEPKK